MIVCFATLVNFHIFCKAHKIMFIKPTTPNDNSTCPSPCYTLLQLYDKHVDNGSFIDSNTTLYFMGGEHTIELQKPGHLVIKDITNLALLNSDPYGAKIVCEMQSFGLAFLNITNLTLRNIVLSNCGTKLSMQLAQDALARQTDQMMKISNQPKAALFAVNVFSLTMIAVEVSNSSGHGFLGMNIIGNSQILYTIFRENNINSYSHCWSQYLTQSEAVDCGGGNVLLLYSDTHMCPRVPVTFNLTVNYSLFVKGVDFVEGVYIPQRSLLGSGLGIGMYQLTYGVKVTLTESTFSGNSAVSHGANLFFGLYHTVVNSSVVIKNCSSTFGNQLFQPPSEPGVYSTGLYPGLKLIHGIFDPRNVSRCNQPRLNTNEVKREEILYIEKCVFENNFGGGLLIQFASGFQLGARPVTHTAIINNSLITRNSGSIIAHPFFTLWALETIRTAKHAELVIENSQFEYNSDTQNLDVLGKLDLPFSGASETYQMLTNLKFTSMNNVTIRNCTFLGNAFSPIQSIDSYIYFEGHNSFIDNEAFFGGAMYLSKDSIAYLGPSTKLYFENNHAREKGGAIYVVDRGLDTDHLCPIQILDPVGTSYGDLETEMIFTNNTAVYAGDAVYGGDVQYCNAPAPSAFLYNFTTSVKGKYVFDFIGNFTGQPQSNSVVSSDATRLCYCIQNIVDCETTNKTLTKYPGQLFVESLVGVGQMGGHSPTIITAVTSAGVKLGSVGRECGVFLGRTADTDVTFEAIFFVDKVSKSSVYLALTILLIPCPVGFELNNSTKVCDCAVSLKKRNITQCDIDTGNITRLPPYWLSNYSDYLLLHDHCPYDYCTPTPVQIKMQEPYISEQCAFNRTGTLCGHCKEGFSLVFGTSRCLRCSNNFLALLVAFTVAGIALVVFLYLLDMTVTIGTINGLIFYANIVKINEAIFFPPGDNSALKVFVSWVNLDLGIETCFYDGMDPYAKTWYQFIFPLFMWLILVVIIASARRSITVARVFGNHAVPILATVFLLSFTKLLRVIITSLSLTTLHYPEGTRALWLYDGNIEFGKQKHAALLIIALFFLIALVPYTLLIASVQLLRKWSHITCLKWVSKCMPIFDAYLGPYKDKYGYWTGLLLVVRVALVLVFVFNIFGDPAVNLLIIILIVLPLIVLNLGQGGVYKKNYLTALEISFMVNLVLLAVVTGFVRQTGGNQKVAVYISTSIALATFAVILIHHIKMKVEDRYKSWKDSKNYRLLQELPLNESDDSGNDVEPNDIEHKPIESVVDVCALQKSSDIESSASQMKPTVNAVCV